MYQKVSTDMNFVDREKQVEKFWRDNDIFRKSLEKNKEGETYTLDADGNPVWMDAVKAEDAPQTGRGLLVGGDYGVYDFNSYKSWQPDYMQQSYDTIIAHATVENYYPVLNYTEEEQKIANTYGEAYNTFVKGELVKFLLGERDMSEWNAFVTEANVDYHGAELTQIAQSAWDRMQAG